MKRIFLTLFCFSVLLGASAQKRKKDSEDGRRPLVSLVSDMTGLDSNYVVYGLPQTVFKVVLTVEQTRFTSGIYAQYADKLLGIPDARQEDEIAYNLQSVQLEAMTELDAKHLYALRNMDVEHKQEFLKLTTQGVLFSPEATVPNTQYTAIPFATSEAPTPRHINMGMDNTTKRVTDTSATAEGPVIFATKTQEERAQEAARFIFQLRKRLYELVTGEIDAVFSSNMALKYAIDEVHRLEQQYLSLFIGTQVKVQSEYVYYLTPDDKNTYTVCYFSEHFGVQDSGGRPVIIELLSDPTLSQVPSQLQPAYDCFKYRIPQIVGVRVLDRNKLLFTGRYMVYQRGPVVNVRCSWF